MEIEETVAALMDIVGELKDEVAETKSQLQEQARKNMELGTTIEELQEKLNQRTAMHNESNSGPETTERWSPCSSDEEARFYGRATQLH